MPRFTPKVLRIFAVIALSWLIVEPSLARSSRFTVSFPLEKSVGPLRAGTFCFPKGSLRGADLVDDEASFALMVREALEDRAIASRLALGDGALPLFELHFLSAKVKLCAKSWGVFGTGNTKSLSGNVELAFAFKFDGQQSLETHNIAFKPELAEGLTANAIMRRGIDLVLGRIETFAP